jgi:hypothetical protein
MTSVHSLLALAFVAVLGCAQQRVGPSVTSSDPGLITFEEIEASRDANAFDLIQRLRPNFLTYRGETSLSKGRSNPYPTVYLDGQEYGPISSLRSIPASQISSIRLLRAWEATTKYGTGNMGGVIAVSTR